MAKAGTIGNRVNVRHLAESTRGNLDDADGNLDATEHQQGEEENDAGERRRDVRENLERVLTARSRIGVVGDRSRRTIGNLAHVRGDLIGTDDTGLEVQVNGDHDGERVDTRRAWCTRRRLVKYRRKNKKAMLKTIGQAAPATTTTFQPVVKSSM